MKASFFFLLIVCVLCACFVPALTVGSYAHKPTPGGKVLSPSIKPKTSVSRPSSPSAGKVSAARIDRSSAPRQTGKAPSWYTTRRVWPAGSLKISSKPIAAKLKARKRDGNKKSNGKSNSAKAKFPVKPASLAGKKVTFNAATAKRPSFGQVSGANARTISPSTSTASTASTVSAASPTRTKTKTRTGKGKGKGSKSFLETAAPISFTPEQVQKVIAALQRTPSDYTFYHWADFKSSIRWGSQKRVDAGEMKFLTSTDSGMASGGGFYFAAEPKSSMSYGPVCCYVRVKQGTLIYNSKAVAAALGVPELNNEAKRILGTLVPFIHSYSGTWWVTHHPDVTSDIKCGTAIITPDISTSTTPTNPVVQVDNLNFGELYAPTPIVPKGSYANLIQLKYNGGWDVFPKDSDFKRPGLAWHNALENIANLKWNDNLEYLNALKGSASWLSDFLILMSYIDGPSLMRAKSLPEGPFNAFDPGHFQMYKDSFRKWVLPVTKVSAVDRVKTTLGLIDSYAGQSKFGSYNAVSAANSLPWGKSLSTGLLSKLYTSLAGKEIQFRDSAVRAGGNYEQDPNNPETGYFLATKGQLDALATNQFLTVEAKPYPQDPSMYLVAYYYPDPLHYSGIKNMLSSELLKDIQAANNYTDPTNGPTLFAAHTKRMMDELIPKAFAAYYGYGVGDSPNDFKSALGLALRMVSIHPCTDFNGRTTRFLNVYAAVAGDRDVPVAFMSDFDIVTNFDLYNQFVVASTAAYSKFKGALVLGMLQAVLGGKEPDHWNNPAWSTFMSESLAPLGTGHSFGLFFSNQENEQVRTRKFIELMDAWFNKNWKGR